VESENIQKYFELLKNAPKRVVLMSPKEDSLKLYKKHIEEANLYLPYIKSGDVVLDLGSGAGFPGIPLAIAVKDAHFYLLDRKAIHTNFLNKVKEELNLENVTVVQMEGELISKKLGVLFDVVTARAFNRIDIVLSMVERNLKQNGIIVLGKKKISKKK